MHVTVAITYYYYSYNLGSLTHAKIMMSEKVDIASCYKLYKLALIYEFINVLYLPSHSPTSSLIS